MDVKARVSSGDELLNEKFTIPSIITTPNPIDFNTYTTPGIYYVGSHSSDTISDTNFINNGPISNWGTLIVSGRYGTLYQIFFTDTYAGIYHRTCDNGKSSGTNYVWRDWTTLIDEKSMLDKAFPVGFSYLNIDGNLSIPSFGTWTSKVYGFIAITDTTFAGAKKPIYVITRTA